MQESQSAATASPTATTIEQDGWTVTSASADHPTAAQLSERLEPETPATPASPADVAAPQEPPAELPTTEGEAQPPLPGKRKQSSTERVREEHARIDAATRERYETQRALETERAELERARRERATFAQPAAPAAPSPTRPTWAMYEAAGKTYEDYETDTATWFDARIEAGTKAAETRAQQIAEERLREAQIQRQRDSVIAQHQARMSHARQAHTDFDQTLKNLDAVTIDPNHELNRVILTHPQGGELLYHLAQHPQDAEALASRPLSRPMQEALVKAPDPRALLSILAQPAEYDRLARLDLPDQIWELSALSRPSASANTGSLAVATVSAAKPPIRPPGGSLSAGGSHSDDPPTDLEAYIRWADAREARAGRLG